MEALTAIQLDPRLAKSYAALGWTQSRGFKEWPAAESSFRKAVSLDPNDGQTHFWFATHLRKKGKFKEAEKEALAALALTHQRDPRIWSELGFLYWTAGWLDKYRAHMEAQLLLYRNDALTRYLYARSLKIQGRFEQAESELSFSEQLGLNPLTVQAERASLYAWRGETERARKLADDLDKSGQSSQIDGLLLAGVYARIGDFDKAIAVLEDAYQRGDNTLLSLATSPVLEPLRRDGRYQALLRRLGFSPQIMQQMELSSSSASGR